MHVPNVSTYWGGGGGRKTAIISGRLFTWPSKSYRKRENGETRVRVHPLTTVVACQFSDWCATDILLLFVGTLATVAISIARFPFQCYLAKSKTLPLFLIFLHLFYWPPGAACQCLNIASFLALTSPFSNMLLAVNSLPPRRACCSLSNPHPTRHSQVS